jgi:hypothetical protein
MQDLTKLVGASLSEANENTGANKFDPETGERLQPTGSDIATSSFGTVIDPGVEWTADGAVSARALAVIALEMTALDDDARLTVCHALPRIEALVSGQRRYSEPATDEL